MKRPTKTAKKLIKGKQWTFPRNTLEDSIQIAKVIEDQNAGNTMRAEELARAMNLSKNSAKFLDLLRSANLYGLVSGVGANATVNITQIGREIIRPLSSEERTAALLRSFRNVDEFRKVEEYFEGKSIRVDEFFYNILIANFDIPQDRVDKFIEIFLLNLRFLRSFNVQRNLADSNAKGNSSIIRNEDFVISNSPDHVRQYLDTCFVMMPFGQWADQYYNEIYIPAIRDASFEPIRADEIFVTGSVMEQIWEQITRSKVLLAELSGKNANVFYELGLAHAASKPVICISSAIEDVPFDLRHLRVIIYDIREPSWAAKLKESITEHLKNAIKEPNKSIPHPFRFDNGLKKIS